MTKTLTMIYSINILNKTSGCVQFTADIDCAATEPASYKIGLAVKTAISGKADLNGADLSWADLRVIGGRSDGNSSWGALAAFTPDVMSSYHLAKRASTG